MTEVKESTTKSMSNDLKRIVLTHEQDLLDIERKFKMDERKLREGTQSNPPSFSSFDLYSSISLPEVAIIRIYFEGFRFLMLPCDIACRKISEMRVLCHKISEDHSHILIDFPIFC